MLITPNHQLIKISQEIIDICQPLVLFHITHFTYQKQFKDGSRISLSNKPQWIADYYNLKLFQSSLFESDQTLYTPRYDVWFGEYDLDVYKHGRQYYNTSHSITITEPEQDGCAFYLFSTSDEHRHALSYLAENKDILHRFILFFKDKAEHLLKKATKNKISLKTLIDPKLLQLPYDEKLIAQSMNERKKEFYKATRIHKLVLSNHGVKLTQRELDCIKYLLQNKTAVETARHMNISRRTAESYLENIKDKMNCSTKVDLIQKLRETSLSYLT